MYLEGEIARENAIQKLKSDLLDARKVISQKDSEKEAIPRDVVRQNKNEIQQLKSE